MNVLAKDPFSDGQTLVPAKVDETQEHDFQAAMSFQKLLAQLFPNVRADRREGRFNAMLNAYGDAYEQTLKHANLDTAGKKGRRIKNLRNAVLAALELGNDQSAKTVSAVMADVYRVTKLLPRKKARAYTKCADIDSAVNGLITDAQMLAIVSTNPGKFKAYGGPVTPPVFDHTAPTATFVRSPVITPQPYPSGRRHRIDDVEKKPSLLKRSVVGAGRYLKNNMDMMTAGVVTGFVIKSTAALLLAGASPLAITTAAAVASGAIMANTRAEYKLMVSNGARKGLRTAAIAAVKSPTQLFNVVTRTGRQRLASRSGALAAGVLGGYIGSQLGDYAMTHLRAAYENGTFDPLVAYAKQKFDQVAAFVLPEVKVEEMPAPLLARTEALPKGDFLGERSASSGVADNAVSVKTIKIVPPAAIDPVPVVEEVVPDVPAPDAVATPTEPTSLAAPVDTNSATSSAPEPTAAAATETAPQAPAAAIVTETPSSTPAPTTPTAQSFTEAAQPLDLQQTFGFAKSNIVDTDAFRDAADLVNQHSKTFRLAKAGNLGAMLTIADKVYAADNEAGLKLYRTMFDAMKDHANDNPHIATNFAKVTRELTNLGGKSTRAYVGAVLKR